jgi:nucleoside 2-deoxyribosyltransferase
MIYLCTPYSNADPAVRQERFEMACRAAAELIRQGKTVFSPIAHSHSICQLGLPLDWAFWERHDMALLKMCDEVVVLKLDGWQESVGVQAEIGAARTLGKPISYLDVRRTMPGENSAQRKAG